MPLAGLSDGSLWGLHVAFMTLVAVPVRGWGEMEGEHAEHMHVLLFVLLS